MDYVAIALSPATERADFGGYFRTQAPRTGDRRDLDRQTTRSTARATAGSARRSHGSRRSVTSGLPLVGRSINHFGSAAGKARNICLTHRSTSGDGSDCWRVFATVIRTPGARSSAHASNNRSIDRYVAGCCSRIGIHLPGQSGAASYWLFAGDAWRTTAGGFTRSRAGRKLNRFGLGVGCKGPAHRACRATSAAGSRWTGNGLSAARRSSQRSAGNLAALSAANWSIGRVHLRG